MANSDKGLQEVRDIIAAAHKDCSLSDKLQFYDRWATRYEEDVSILEYKAPRLAARALASVCLVNRELQLVLDVACGTGRAAEEESHSGLPSHCRRFYINVIYKSSYRDRAEDAQSNAKSERLQRYGFNLFHGLDGSAGMLEIAKKKDLYLELKQSMLGQEQLPYDSEKYDAVIIVGALSDGQVPVSVLPELLRVAKPGGFVCMTTRSNISNLHYKAELEEEIASLHSKRLWKHVLVQEVEQWEKATSDKEITQESDYIPGVIYIFRKMLPLPIVS